ncbi:hypothetical protein F4775DRAFT_595067 [Biscogniauxia sp. FL1348]|nr:hypothetical protein F4775DRAFT_595067 [Biscogniauxia sp. FL1348]
MPPRNIVPLHDLFYTGYDGGLRWRTFGSMEWEEDQTTGYNDYAFLLQHNYAFHISKCIVKGLGTTDKMEISEAFAELYELATEYIVQCRYMPPKEYFARAKNSREWSAKISDEAFWAFTYKAFHARAIFRKHQSLRAKDESKEDSEEKEMPAGQPLMYALDKFRAAFDEMYIENYIPEPKKNPHPEEIDEENGLMAMFKSTRAAYFPYALTNAGGEGDGFDKIYRTKVVKKTAGDSIHNHQSGLERGDRKVEVGMKARIQGLNLEDNSEMDIDMDAEGEEEEVWFYYDFGPEKPGAEPNNNNNNNGDEANDDGDVEMMDVAEAEARKTAETVAAMRELALQ